MPQSDYSGLAPQTQLVGTLPASSGPGTVIQLLNGAGYPTGATGIAFSLTFDRGSSTEEKILCSLRSGNNVTILSRGYDDTVAVDHASGAQINHTVDATILRTASAHIYDTTLDQHLQYSRVDGTRSFTGKVTVATGGVDVTGASTLRGATTITTGGLTVTGANVVAQSGATPVTVGLVASAAASGFEVGAGGVTYLGIVAANTWGWYANSTRQIEVGDTGGPAGTSSLKIREGAALQVVKVGAAGTGPGGVGKALYL